jgi:O-antigen ligase
VDPDRVNDNGVERLWVTAHPVSDDTRERRWAMALLVTAVSTVVWGTLSFGAVYPWAYRPLALMCAATGLLALAFKGRRDVFTPALALWCAAVAITVALQLVPLPRGLLAMVSPGTDRFLNEYDLAYRASGLMTTGSAGFGVAPRWPISLSPPATLIGLSLFVSFALFMLGLVRVLSTTGGLPAVRAIVAFGALLAIFAIAQYVVSGGETYRLKIYGFWQPTYRGSPFGSFINRNHFAGWMLMVLPIAVMSAYGAGVSQRHSGIRGVVAWLSLSPVAAQMQLMALAAAVMGGAILLSQSRSGTAALLFQGIIMGGLMVRRHRDTRTRLVTLVLLIAAGLVVAAWVGMDRLVSRAATVVQDLPTGGGRLVAWRDTARIIGDFPVAGTGLNTYKTAMIVYQTRARDLHFQEAHNDYLQLASEGGLLVGIPAAILIVVFVRTIRRRFAEAPQEGTTYWLRIGAVIGLAGIALQALVEFSLQMPGNAALFALVAALALHRSPNLRPRSVLAGVIDMPPSF